MKSYTHIDIIPTFFFNYKSKKGDQKKKNHFATKNITGSKIFPTYGLYIS